MSVVWFTGLPAAGKSTLAEAVASKLREDGRSVEVLDGDLLRRHLSADLDFSPAGRDAHVARVAFVAELLSRNGVAVLVALISPFRRAREAARARCTHFVEVFVSTPIEECIRRDPKGLYAKARAGDLPGFTGIDAPYEMPLSPEVTVDTTQISVADAAAKIVDAIVAHGRGEP